MEALVVLQEAAVDRPAAYRDLDTAFHHRLGELGGNEFLARAAQSLNILGQEFRKTASETPNVIATSITDHRSIITALQAGETETARATMVTHMNHVLQSTRSSMQARKEDD